jgi:hypothetical protein
MKVPLEERLLAELLLSASAHFSPDIVARSRRGTWIQGARRFGRGGVVDTTSSTRTKRNAGDAYPGGSVADGWREMPASHVLYKVGTA